MPGASVEEAVREAARQQPGLRLVVWFGSTARGDATPGSDVDLGVLGGDGAALAAEVSRAVGREVDLVSLEGELPVPLLEALVRDGRVIWRADATAEGAARARRCRLHARPQQLQRFTFRACRRPTRLPTDGCRSCPPPSPRWPWSRSNPTCGRRSPPTAPRRGRRAGSRRPGDEGRPPSSRRPPRAAGARDRAADGSPQGRTGSTTSEGKGSTRSVASITRPLSS